MADHIQWALGFLKAESRLKYSPFFLITPRL
ncbi:Uncharacterised protein [Vibrio cholerae]|nr:Uncharacterised protein [Vibrio cholerae]